MLLTRIFSCTIALSLITAGTAQAHGTKALENVTKTAGMMSTFCKNCLHNKAAICAFVVFAAGYIRLMTKPSPKVKVTRDWKEYFTQLASLLNVTQIGTSEYWNTADQIIIGDPLKLVDQSKKTVDENGFDVTLKEKIVKVKPSGAFGYFYSYILFNLKTLFEHLENLTKLDGYLNSACE